MTFERPRSYRKRIYGTYVSARDRPLAPETLAGLRPRLPYLTRLVNRHFPKDLDSAILDLGCGHGALLHVLSIAGYRNIKGVDGSPEQVTAAQKLGIHGVEQGEALQALGAAPDQSFDVVVTFDVIEHFTKYELPPFIDELHRVLRPGGRWILHVPNAESPFGSRMRHWDFTHELAFTRTSLTQLLRASGFTTVACYEDRPIPHGPLSLVRAVFWVCIRACLLFYIAVETGALDRGAVFSQNVLAVAIRD